jgi:hypothetical protein
MTHSLVGTGVWSSALRYGDPAEIAPAAAELETLGYSALWIPDVGGDVFGPIGNLLAADQRRRSSPPGFSTCGCTRQRRPPNNTPR